MDITDNASGMSTFMDDVAMKNHKQKKKTPYIKTDYCIDCGEDIPEERKAVEPTCERCVVCQDKHDKFERGLR